MLAVRRTMITFSHCSTYLMTVSFKKRFAYIAFFLVASIHEHFVHSLGTILPFSPFSPFARVPKAFDPHRSCSSTTTSLHAILSSNSQRTMYRGRAGVKFPLLVLADEDNPRAIRPIPFPMPANHLPITEVTSLNLYGTELSSPAHYRLVQEVKASPEKLFGYVAWKNPSAEENQSDLVGSIGVACQIISNNAVVDAKTSDFLDQNQMFGKMDEKASSTSKISDLFSPGMDTTGISPPDEMTVEELSTSPSVVNILFRGTFRFVVRSIESIFPYPIAIVDELVDEAVEISNVEADNIDSTSNFEEDAEENRDEEEDEEDDYGDMYSELSSRELTFRCLNAMQSLVKMRLDANPDMSPLEKEILKTFQSEGGGSNTFELERASAENMASLLEIFRAELVEMTDVTLRRYVIGMMMCEVGNVSFDVRCEALRCTDGIARLRTLLAILEEKISLARAKNVAQQIVDIANVDNKQLKVGQPSLPPWANQIREGIKIEYYWNEEVGWFRGTVKGVSKVLDEILITVEFDDGETHRLPFNGYEKVRWRPAAE